LAAEAAFQKAITLNPSYALAHRLLGIIQMHLCRRQQSLAAIQRARELDPLNAGHYALSAQVAFAAREFGTAIKFAQQAIAIDPEFWIGHMQLGQAYEQCGENERAVSALTEAGRLSGGNSKAISLRGYILARSGRTQEVRELLRTLESVSREKYVPPYAFALIHAGLSEHEVAFDFLQRAYGVRDVHLAFLTCDPKWDPFRKDPRFADLIAIFFTTGCEKPAAPGS
jgi:Flp pilus assembly protein TadD